MIADAASPASITTSVRRAPTRNGAMLYDASRLSNAADESLFDLKSWLAAPATTRTPGGRGAALFIEHAGRAWVLRHYQRGGFMARLTADRYWWTGEERTRPFREWRLLEQLRAAGLPVPAPIAARYARHGLTYRGDLITERIRGAQPVSALLASASLPEATWRAIGRCVRRLHKAGVWHADLNAHNILIGGDAHVSLVDFDRARQRAPGRWCEANLARLERSLRKICRDLPPDRFTAKDWAALRAGYDSAASGASG
jgi:3-deoxy-D-manno-octulosonic acid kinase